MTSDERARLTHRTEDLRRLFEGTTDSRARFAINAEIAKYEALSAEIDSKAPDEPPADQPEEIVAKAPRECSLAFTIDNVQRFTFAGAPHRAFRGDPSARVRAGERKTC